ncbi:2-C-methyl-D-erythritol 4-phosphate cytidylyltransferase [Mucilaginibacter sp. PAMC 26640]|nr:2-C-methyl-D-erythritol 4-phosphate cytidylyltransferase [Mucilaginibacter sp. PAMC 26640]
MDSKPTSSIPNLTSKTYAVIVAGGSGTRMQSVMPKQFILLNGRPVLMHTMEAFRACTAQPELVLVLHTDYHSFWKQLCEEHNFVIKHKLIAGGQTRFHSVKNAIDYITEKNVLIAVHDAVRPLISPTIIDEAFRCAETQGSAVVAVKSRDSVRQTFGERSESLNRDNIYLVQTPQTFKSEILRLAYEQTFDPYFTDDASVVERNGAQITIVQGHHSNIKITFPEDIAIAEAIINKKPQA